MNLRRLGLALVVVSAPLGLLACSSSDSSPSGAGGGSDDAGASDAGGEADLDAGADVRSDAAEGGLVNGVLLGCDPLVPTYCGFPFPSSVRLADDAATVTGKRVAFTSEMLPRHNRYKTDPKPWADLDGFSPTGTLLAHFPTATIAGLPSQDDLGLSVTTASPTIVVDVSTGELVPHFAELDMTARNDDERTFMIRPVVRLKDATRYLVAIRHVKDASGAEIAPSPAFAALRDGTPSDDASVEDRRALYADVFAKLASAGVERESLQLAWDFSTASRESITKYMVQMRDEALAAVGTKGPSYEITSVEDDPNPHVRRRIHGYMNAPSWLDTTESGGTVVFGADGKPARQGTAKFGFVVHVPNSAVNGTPGYLLQNGHGLLGGFDEGANSYLATIADEKNYVAFAVNWVGMSGSDDVAGVGDDFPTIANALTGDIGDFAKVVMRQHQGVVNSLVAMRMMRGDFAADPAVTFDGKSAIDTSQGFYRGDSQGGIFGTTYMAVTTDVTRGLVSVPGAPYSLLLNRSADFGPFFTLIRGVYPTAMDIQMVLGMVQMLWDRTDPGGYAGYLTGSTLSGTPAHQLLIHVGLGDHQVTPLGAEWIARTVGAKTLAPQTRAVWGIDEAASPYAGSSALVEFDYGLPAAPKTNTPPGGFPDPHEWVRKTPEAYGQADVFFRTGRFEQTCAGACTLPQPN